jgi:deoxyribonuclease-4
MSTGGGVHKAPERGEAATCDVIQVFTKNNMQWNSKPLPANAGVLFQEACERHGIQLAFGHTSYLINLGAVEEPTIERSIAALKDEIERADLLGLPFLVLHPGGHMGEGEDKGLQTIASRLDQVLSESPESRVKIALEITAGQGTQLGFSFGHLAALIEMAEYSDRLGVCLDTAHMFAAGYDIRTEESYTSTMAEMEDTIPLDRLLAWHLNDSKADLGSRVDRHQHIGKGLIGVEAFRLLINDVRFRDLPMILETPKGKTHSEDIENLSLLRSLLIEG